MAISDEICDAHHLAVFYVGPDDESVVGGDGKPLTHGYYYGVYEGRFDDWGAVVPPVGPFTLRKQALLAMLAEIIQV